MVNGEWSNYSPLTTHYSLLAIRYSLFAISIRLRGGLGDLAARLAHGGGGGVRHQPRVVEQGAQLIALAEAAHRGLRAVGVHARDLAVLARDVADLFDGREHLAVLRIERRRRLAHAHAEVGGTDVDAVDAVDRDDVGEVLDRRARLDHGEQQDLAVGMLPIVGAAVEHGAVRPHAAAAARRVAARRDQRLGLGLRVD